MVSIAAAIVFFLLFAGAVWQWSKAQKSERQARTAEKTASANEARALTALSQVATSQGYYSDAVKLALAAWPRSAADARPPIPDDRRIRGYGREAAINPQRDRL